MNRPLLGQIARKTTGLRRELHKYPEIANLEAGTAGIIAKVLEETGPDALLTGIGGYGLAAVYNGSEDGAAVMFRAELDALPVADEIDTGYRSVNEGLGHKCGHDGHMAVLVGLGMYFKEHPPAKGKAILLFQPAEETGEGSKRVIEDARFRELKPDYAFAYHNIPGYEKHAIILREGIFATASRGFIAKLRGKTSHAAHPDQGINPARSMAHLIMKLESLPAEVITAGEYALVTFSDQVMQVLVQEAEHYVKSLEQPSGLKTVFEWTEEFLATENDSTAAGMVKTCATDNGITVIEKKEPFPWSEDFGRFSEQTRAALFGIGAGKEHSELHSPGYDFPDEITETALTLFAAIADRLLNTE
ncbi:MAG: M20/M25/M40 family metallo-hydrolase [Rhodothermaceae bacterium]|nr:M20/M25/M40 family metallo-hydrolase [Rhodothermaceae bacterium]